MIQPAQASDQVLEAIVDLLCCVVECPTCGQFVPVGERCQKCSEENEKKS